MVVVPSWCTRDEGAAVPREQCAALLRKLCVVDALFGGDHRTTHGIDRRERSRHADLRRTCRACRSRLPHNAIYDINITRALTNALPSTRTLTTATASFRSIFAFWKQGTKCTHTACAT